MLRKHQERFAQVIDGIIAGTPIKTIICEGSPGTGKSLLPVIAGKLITAGLSDALCWVCPRKTLQLQGEQSFQDPLFREMIGHNLTIRSSTNEHNPCRGLNGLITTYQAISIDHRHAVLNDFKAKRYILILDEFHHAADGGVWHEALQPLVDRAAYLILMTGTMERGNGSKIAFTSCCAETTAKIKYGRKAALEEKAIIPLHFLFSDASTEWIEYDGQEIKHDSISSMPRKDVAKAIHTAINTEYAEGLLTKGLAHWTGHKRRHPSSKLLIVTANVALAKKAVAFLGKNNYKAEIATSHESAAAQAAIKNFKAGFTDILVGVAMFYEGFDCKQVSHIISLTHIRSKPWLEQMFARAVRVDTDAGPYETQYGYIFAPADQLIRDVVDRIEAEQAPFIKKQTPRDQLLFDGYNNGNGESQEPGGNIYGIRPLGSSLTNGREIILGHQQPSQPEIPSETEASLRDQIELHVRQFSFINRYKPARINKELKIRFGKARGEMTITELRAALAYISANYPLGAKRLGVPVESSASKPRGRGDRVSPKANRRYGGATR